MSTPEPQSKKRKKSSISHGTSQSDTVNYNSDRYSDNSNNSDVQVDSDVQADSDVQVAAYYKAQARGFEPGHELDDWLSAEEEAKQ